MVQKVALRPYLDNLAAEANPIFRNRWLSLGDRLLEHTAVNATAVGRSLRIHTILSLGATGTGVGFHSHTENWLAQVQGRKAWSLAAPGSNMRPEWQAGNGCALFQSAVGVKPIQCIVEPGQAIYLPTDWSHATCNLDPLTLSFGGQGDIGVFSGRKLIDAILDNDEEAALKMLKSRPKRVRQLLKAKAETGHSAVHIAIMHNRLWALRALLDAGADLSEPLLCTDAGKGDCALLAGSPWWNEPSPEGVHVLYLATMYGTLDALKFLVEEGGVEVGTRMRVGRKIQG